MIWLINLTLLRRLLDWKQKPFCLNLLFLQHSIWLSDYLQEPDESWWMNGPLWITNSNPLVTHLKTLKDSLLESRDLQSMSESNTLTYGVAYRTLEQKQGLYQLTYCITFQRKTPDYREIKRCDVMKLETCLMTQFELCSTIEIMMYFRKT